MTKPSPDAGQLVLAFDTSAAHCAAALIRGGEVLETTVEAMQKGQAERLFPLLEQVLRSAEVSWRDLDALGVGVGPGNFTGIRISVSAARGLALGLGIPAIGVDGFDSREACAKPDQLVVIDAPRDQVYIRLDGQSPRLTTRQEAAQIKPLADTVPPLEMVISIAQIAASRLHGNITAPTPLYVRSANAAPSSDLPPKILTE